MLSFVLIGIVLGSVLAFSGAGGAIVGIPLLMHWGGLPLGAATALVVPVLGVGAFLAWIPQFRNTRWQIWVAMAPFLLGSATVSGAIIRPWMSEWVIQSILVVFVCWGLWQTWWGNQLQSVNISEHKRWITPFLGLITGCLTVLTGLGGGLVLVPVLRKYLGLDMPQAVATSLITIVFSAIVSAITLTVSGQMPVFLNSEFLGLLAGLVIISMLFRILVPRLPDKIRQHIQKILYSVILIFSLLSILGPIK